VTPHKAAADGVPRTVAGRVLMGLVFDGQPEPNPPANPEALLTAILAIEAEAAQPSPGLDIALLADVLADVDVDPYAIAAEYARLRGGDRG
jgi:hypothetical protein